MSINRNSHIEMKQNIARSRLLCRIAKKAYCRSKNSECRANLENCVEQRKYLLKKLVLCNFDCNLPDKIEERSNGNTNTVTSQNKNG